jgi:hypothetical protein
MGLSPLFLSPSLLYHFYRFPNSHPGVRAVARSGIK